MAAQTVPRMAAMWATKMAAQTVGLWGMPPVSQMAVCLARNLAENSAVSWAAQTAEY